MSGGPGVEWLLTALGALDGVREAGAEAWGVRHSYPPPGTRAVTCGVLIVVLRLQGREQWAKRALVLITPYQLLALFLASTRATDPHQHSNTLRPWWGARHHGSCHYLDHSSSPNHGLAFRNPFFFFFGG